MKKTDVVRRTKGKIVLGTLVGTLALGAAGGTLADSNRKNVGGWQPATQALRTDQSQVPGGCQARSSCFAARTSSSRRTGIVTGAA